MAERLTDKVLLKKLVNGYYGDIDVYQKSYIKLGMLEDIMEKYNIKTVEELDKRLEDVEQYNYETNHQFIDVMAKYGIESIEELDNKLKILQGVELLKEHDCDISEYVICEKDVIDKYETRILVLEQDRDTWQKACELACETLKQVMGKPLWIGGNIPTPEVKDSDYFYQQAKTEGSDE